MTALPRFAIGRTLGVPKRHGAVGALRSAVTAAFVLFVGLPSSAALAQDRPQRLPTIELGAGMHRIKAEVALTPEQRAIGLMHRSSLGANEGMLFVFESPSQQCFWMKNTLIPLAIAYLDDEGRVVNIEEMKAQSLDSHCSTGPVRFALEMNAGWFSRRGIGPGFRLTGRVFKQPPPNP